MHSWKQKCISKKTNEEWSSRPPGAELGAPLIGGGGVETGVEAWDLEGTGAVTVRSSAGDEGGVEIDFEVDLSSGSL